MAYTNFTNCTEEEYVDIIYSESETNRIRIWFNNVELADAGQYCESLSGTNRILPTDGSKRFSISNFISREYELVLRDLPVGTLIEDQVKISIGTLVDEDNEIYEDVPIGIFNIQDMPTTDKNKITIKLRDNRVKFDFGYNAKPLIDANGGKASYKQILNDMCSKAGVISDVTTFNGENIEVAIYDSTIKATNYVSYIAEQAGAIPVITREGHLAFIYVNNLKTWEIPLDLIEKYEKGIPYTIQRVVYESGIIKYETSADQTLETLYLSSENIYISNQAQVDSVLPIVNNFTIDSVTTGKVLGNPAIDPYDLIQIYGYYQTDEYGNEIFVPDKEIIVFKTLANNTYKFNGIHRNTFDTIIGKEERKENVIKSGDETFKRWATTEINNLNATVTTTAGEVESVRVVVLGNYVLTKDDTYDTTKNYYILEDGEYVLFPQYEEYEGERTGNPYELGLYETTIVPQYDLTDDTVFEEDKVYYEYDAEEEEYTVYTGERTGNPSELSLYEVTERLTTYVLTSDTTFRQNKNYYIRNFVAGASIPSHTIYELQGSIYETINENNKDLEEKITTSQQNAIQTAQEYTNSQIQQSKTEIEASFTTTYVTDDELQQATDNINNEIKKYLRYVNEGNGRVELGVNTDNVELRLQNNKIYFYDKNGGGNDNLDDENNSNVLAYISDKKLYIKSAKFLTQIQIGNFAFTPRTNGSLSFKKVV